MVLSADRNTHQKAGIQFVRPLAAAVKAYAGGLAVLDSDGNSKPGVVAVGLIADGRYEQTVDNSLGGPAAKSAKVEHGVFKWANSLAADEITKAQIGDACYIVDDETVAKTSNGNTRSVAGIIKDVDTDGVWVETPHAFGADGDLVAALNLADVADVPTARASLGLAATDGPTFDHVHLTGDIDVGDDCRVTGLATIGETLAVTGYATALQKTQVVAANTFTVQNAIDGDIVILAGADNDVVTLPDAAAGNLGQRVTVVNIGGAIKVSISPSASDKIYGGIHGAATGDLVTFAEGVNKDIINTKGTALKGDHAVLVSDGATGWYVIGGKGVWASEG